MRAGNRKNVTYLGPLSASEGVMVRKAKHSPGSRSRPGTPTRGGRLTRAKRVLISAFLIFHIVAITCWCVPVNTPLTALSKELLRPYFVWSGLFQSWDMFSPSPKKINSYLEAIVLYKDGNTRIWPFPRMEHLSLTDRYFQERYRKFAEVLSDDKYAPLWPDAARFIARMNNNRSVPVKMVMLVRYWSDIVPRSGGPDRPSVRDTNVFYGYSVQPGDLK
jgi:hypothetical protein